jgi:hypothetical protein
LLPSVCQWLDLSFKSNKGNVGIAVTTETLKAPIPHVALLKPCKALGCVARSSDCDAFVLAPCEAVDTVAGTDLGILAKGNATR